MSSLRNIQTQIAQLALYRSESDGDRRAERVALGVALLVLIGAYLAALMTRPPTSVDVKKVDIQEPVPLIQFEPIRWRSVACPLFSGKIPHE